VNSLRSLFFFVSSFLSCNIKTSEYPVNVWIVQINFVIYILRSDICFKKVCVNCKYKKCIFLVFWLYSRWPGQEMGITHVLHYLFIKSQWRIAAISFKRLGFCPSIDSSEPHNLTEIELNNLIRDLELPQNKAEFLASRLQQWVGEPCLDTGREVSVNKNR
jgi:hypothetical protein